MSYYKGHIIYHTNMIVRCDTKKVLSFVILKGTYDVCEAHTTLFMAGNGVTMIPL